MLIYTEQGHEKSFQQAIMLRGYVDCALWSCELDNKFEPSQIEESSKIQAMKDIEEFVNDNKDLLQASELDASQIGHDLWLTRNGHGSGFWDRGLEDEIGDGLTDKAKDIGMKEAYSNGEKFIIE